MAKHNENAIKEAAYYIWVDAGMPYGRDEEFWLLAIEQLGSCKKASCGCSASKKPAPKKPAAKKPAAKAAPKAAPQKTAEIKK